MSVLFVFRSSLVNSGKKKNGESSNQRYTTWCHELLTAKTERERERERWTEARIFIARIKWFYNRIKFIRSFCLHVMLRIQKKCPQSCGWKKKKKKKQKKRIFQLTCHVMMMWSFSQHVVVFTYKLIIVQHIQLFTGTQLFPTYTARKAI